MTSERFDLVTALFALTNDYHSGQWSRGYRLNSRIITAYRPHNIPCDLSELFRRRKDYRNALYIYIRLARKYGGKL